MPIKPMLAASNKAEEVLATVKFPVLASPKLDGIRGFVEGGMVFSRNLKPLPNMHLQERFGWAEYSFYDGEFVVGSPTDTKCFNKTTSIVMADGKPIDDVKFYVFDFINHEPYDQRSARLEGDDGVVVLQQNYVDNMDDLMAYESDSVDMGYEGVILRDPRGRYKYGRSTLNEGLLLKLKRFEDSEALVIGFEERMHNANEKTLVKNGKAARSSHQAGLVGLGTLGALRVRWRGIEFNIGSGFDADEAQYIWDHQDAFLGKWVKFRYFPHGMKDAPRHPVFIGWRDERDMS